MVKYRQEFYLQEQFLFNTEAQLDLPEPTAEAPYIALEIAHETRAKFASAAKRNAESIEIRVLRQDPPPAISEPVMATAGGDHA